MAKGAAAAAAAASEASSAEDVARPYTNMFGAEAQSFICLLKTDKALAKKWCPDLVDEHGTSTVNGKTYAETILLALVRRLGGELVRVRDKGEGKTKTEKIASLFKLKQRQGRPNRSTAIADAAAKLVKDRGEQRVLSGAVRRKRSKSAPPRLRTSDHRVGKFSSRGNAMTPLKKCAVVEVCNTPMPMRTRTH